jgi:hypothetical protein
MSRRVKAEKHRESVARRSQRSQAGDDVHMDDAREEQDDEAARLERVLATIANYPDQPLEAGQDAKLRVAASEINANNNLYTHAIEDMLDTATMLADAMPSEENPFENEVRDLVNHGTESLTGHGLGDDKNQEVTVSPVGQATCSSAVSGCIGDGCEEASRRRATDCECVLLWT